MGLDPSLARPSVQASVRIFVERSRAEVFLKHSRFNGSCCQNYFFVFECRTWHSLRGAPVRPRSLGRLTAVGPARAERNASFVRPRGLRNTETPAAPSRSDGR